MLMDFAQQFDLMRPYNDSEVCGAIARVLSHQYCKGVFNYLYPNESFDSLVQKFNNINTVDQFQSFFSHHAVRKVVELTSDGLSFSGLENLDKNKAYLFIANHRDIVMDSAMMQIILVENNYKTTQITFGSNLMSDQIIIDLGKLNKMFTFYRGGSRREIYLNAILHSAYINHVIKGLNESVWIAQRDGRTKDGNDLTQTGLIKMFSAGSTNVIDTLKNLNIVPVTVSYEYEPCDNFKVRELVLSKKDVYVKQAGEDINSILTGITGYKGHIHMAFGTSLNSFIESHKEESDFATNYAEVIVTEIDRQIHADYKLWPINYIAYDMMNATSSFSEKKYSNDQKTKFVSYMEKKLSAIKCDTSDMRELFIRLYAMPVVNETRDTDITT